MRYSLVINHAMLVIKRRRNFNSKDQREAFCKFKKGAQRSLKVPLSENELRWICQSVVSVIICSWNIWSSCTPPDWFWNQPLSLVLAESTMCSRFYFAAVFTVCSSLGQEKMRSALRFPSFLQTLTFRLHCTQPSTFNKRWLKRILQTLRKSSPYNKFLLAVGGENFGSSLDAQ